MAANLRACGPFNSWFDYFVSGYGYVDGDGFVLMAMLLGSCNVMNNFFFFPFQVMWLEHAAPFLWQMSDVIFEVMDLSLIHPVFGQGIIKSIWPMNNYFGVRFRCDWSNLRHDHLNSHIIVQCWTWPNVMVETTWTACYSAGEFVSNCFAFHGSMP